MSFIKIAFLLSTLLVSSQDSLDHCTGTIETYVEYKDNGSLPIYDAPNGKKIDTFRFEDDPQFDFGKSIEFDDCTIGWFRIKSISTDLPQNDLIGKWVHYSYVRFGTTNYDRSPIPIKKSPNNNSETIGSINDETELYPLSFCNGWILVDHGVQGWLAPEHICNNEVTNCN